MFVAELPTLNHAQSIATLPTSWDYEAVRNTRIKAL